MSNNAVSTKVVRSKATSLEWSQAAERFFKKRAAQRVADKQNAEVVHPHTGIRCTGFIGRWVKKNLWPYWFQYYRVPNERAAQAHYLNHARRLGFQADDFKVAEIPLHALAYELMPRHLKETRERRTTQTRFLNMTRLEQFPEEQNYDPFIPYLAPYIEEARFMLQEEEELLGYHQWQRLFLKGGRTGFGEKERHIKILTILRI